MRRPPQSQPFEISAERCWSGRTGLPAKQLSRQNRDRGFESPPLRHLLDPTAALVLARKSARITNDRDTTRSQAFTYDQVNRVLTAQTPGSCGSNCWSQAFTYDQWANLQSVAATGTAPPLTNLAVNTSNRVTLAGFNYDAAGNETSDVTNTYIWNAESEIKTAGGVTYSYDGDGNRVEKSNGKIYWYGPGSEVLDESDASGNITDEYVYFGGKRVAHRVVSSNSVYYYAEDMLGSSRALGTPNGTPCYDADFYPYGGEHDYVNTCAQNYKFTGKERDPETNNDDFNARYYSSAYGRFLSADWSSTPSPVPYANLTNPQTLNLYAMVSDNPESFADLDGHENAAPNDPSKGACAESGTSACGTQIAEQNSATAQNRVQVQATVIEQGKVVQGEKQADGTSVTGVRGIIQDTITVNGKPLSGVEVNETNVSTVTVNGKPMFPQEKPGSATTNNAGQINDTVGLLAPARTAAQDKALTEGLRTQAVTVTNTNTITFAIPGSSKYTATSTRTLTNVGSDGRVGSTYTLSKTDPVVRAVP
jgi:RHS repeat-associated protein